MRAIYVRTSVEDNDGAAQLHELLGQAVVREWLTPAQAEVLRSRAAEYAGTVLAGVLEGDVLLFVERGQSGAKASRPAWDILLERVRFREVSEVMATELSRFGRSVVNVILALDELRRLGCNVVLTRQGLDYSTPVGRAVAAILAAVAQLERDQLRERIQAGMRKAREKGTRSGKSIGRGEVSVDVERAARLRGEGVSWRAIAQAMRVKEPTLRRKTREWMRQKGVAETAA